MADNFIGNRMDDYLAGRLASGRTRRLTHSGARPGCLSIPVDTDSLVWIDSGALSPAGVQLVAALTGAGLHVAFRAPAGRNGAALAQRYGARHFPDGVPAPEARFCARVESDVISLDSGRVVVGFAPGSETNAALLAATFCSEAGTSSSASITVNL